jgi:hypothetical protein
MLMLGSVSAEAVAQRYFARAKVSEEASSATSAPATPPTSTPATPATPPPPVSGDRCIGGSLLGDYVMTNNAATGLTFTGDSRFSTSGYCASIGGNCAEGNTLQNYDESTGWTVNLVRRCMAGSTGVTPAGSNDSFSSTATAQYQAVYSPS